MAVWASHPLGSDPLNYQDGLPLTNKAPPLRGMIVPGGGLPTPPGLLPQHRHSG